ncbi:MAG: hypothetical protein CMI90_00270 [Pelagibacteraceae bacterium]|nr:hypothetical protein [Pelagibacteraceae bacterium]
MKVLAIIVTFNRKKLLKRCLDAIQNQSLQPNEILVVNNDSNDGTQEFLNINKINHITQKNVGSAGGWKTGIDYALKFQFDGVWMMDDDGYPEKNALKILIENLNSSISCISSVVINEDDKNTFTFPYPILNNRNYPKIFALKRKIKTLSNFKIEYKDNFYPYAQLFNGSLIDTNFIREIGNINFNYYIFGDETDFFYRLKSKGKVISILNSIHYHPNVSNRPYNLIKIYYYLKNSIIINNKYMDFPITRSILNIIAIIFRTAARNGIFYIVSILLGKKKFFFYKAIMRGFKGKLAKDFDD